MAKCSGIDISPGAIRAAVIEQRGSVSHVLALAEVPWNGGGVEALTAALRDLRRAIPLTSSVVVGLPASTAMMMTVDPLIVDPTHADLAVGFELQQRLPYDVAQAAWHYQWWTTNGASRSSPAKTSAPASQSAPRTAVVVAMKQALMHERLDACHRAGIHVAAIQISTLAAVNLWWTKKPAAGAWPAIVLYVDGPTLAWIIVTQHGLDVVPGSMATATTGTAEADHLNSLKTSWEAVQEHLQLKGLGHSTKPNVWVVGSWAEKSSMLSALGQTLGCHVQALPLSSLMTIEPAAQSSAESCAIAAGLALQGLRVVPWSLDLLTQRSQQQRETRITRTAQLMSLAAGALALLFLGRGMWTMMSTRQAIARQLTEQEQTYQQLRPEVRRLREQQATLERRLQNLEQLAKRQGQAELAFERMVQALPDTTWLAKADLVKIATTLEGTLEGHAKSFQGVTQLMERLKSAGWETVKPLSTTVVMDPITGSEVIAFAVKLQQPLPTIAPTMDVVPVSSKRDPAVRQTPPPARGSNAPRR